MEKYKDIEFFENVRYRCKKKSFWRLNVPKDDNDIVLKDITAFATFFYMPVACIYNRGHFHGSSEQYQNIPHIPPAPGPKLQRDLNRPS